MEPLRVSEVHSSLSQWTSVILVMEASCTKTTHAGRASKIYRRFVFSDSHGVKVSAVAFDDNVARIEGLLLPFKKYCIGGASVEEVPRPASPDLYRFFWILTRDTLINEVFEPGTPSLSPFFDLTPFTSFQHLADSHVSIKKPCSSPKSQLCFDKKQHVSEAESQPSAITIPDMPCGSSKTRVCLAKRMELSEEAGATISDTCAIASSKKPKNA